VNVGDAGDWHSLCRHEPNETQNARLKPSFRLDIASFAGAWMILEDELPRSYQPRKHITLGNHEDWAWQFENLNPEMRGHCIGPMTRVFES
jgi:hypothetical protein